MLFCSGDLQVEACGPESPGFKLQSIPPGRSLYARNDEYDFNSFKFPFICQLCSSCVRGKGMCETQYALKLLRGWGGWGWGGGADFPSCLRARSDWNSLLIDVACSSPAPKPPALFFIYLLLDLHIHFLPAISSDLCCGPFISTSASRQAAFLHSSSFTGICGRGAPIEIIQPANVSTDAALVCARRFC